jgi:hypothetical protein
VLPPLPRRHAALSCKVLEVAPSRERFFLVLVREGEIERLCKIGEHDNGRGGRSLLMDPSLVEKPWPCLRACAIDRPPTDEDASSSGSMASAFCN